MGSVFHNLCLRLSRCLRPLPICPLGYDSNLYLLKLDVLCKHYNGNLMEFLSEISINGHYVFHCFRLVSLKI